MERVYVTMVGEYVIVNRSIDGHLNEVMNITAEVIRENIRKTDEIGDCRYNVKARTVLTDLGK